jgi:hypothetical protein
MHRDGVTNTGGGKFYCCSENQRAVTEQEMGSGGESYGGASGSSCSNLKRRGRWVEDVIHSACSDTRGHNARKNNRISEQQREISHIDAVCNYTALGSFHGGIIDPGVQDSGIADPQPHAIIGAVNCHFKRVRAS